VGVLVSGASVRVRDAATYRRDYTVGVGARFPLGQGCYGNDTLAPYRKSACIDD
jgi:hypothetical protein